MKKSFSFRRKWLDAINLIEDAAIRAEITLAVIEYALNGTPVSSESDVVQAMAALIISQMPKRRADTPTEVKTETMIQPETEIETKPEPETALRAARRITPPPACHINAARYHASKAIQAVPACAPTASSGCTTIAP